MTEDIARQILHAVAHRPSINGLRLIGVDGCSGSGKSTLARRLAKQSGAAVIEVDDFVSWDEFSGWWPRFDQQVLQPLHAGRDAVFQTRDWINDWRGGSLGAWKTVTWNPLVIIEGVTCTRRVTSGLLAYAVWVQAPADIRLARGLARDHEHGQDVPALWARWMAEEDEFFTADGTRDRADKIVTTAE